MNAENISKDHTLCKVAILAGGMGTRLKTSSGNCPKPMVKILGVPMLEHQVRMCKEFGFDNILLITCYRSEIIEEYFKDGSEFGVHIKYFVETTPRGTGGALYDSLELLDERFLVLYGDTYFDIDLLSIWRYHEKNGSGCTIVVHPNDHPSDSDLVVVDDNGWVAKIIQYPHAETEDSRNLVNAAMYVLDKRSLDRCIPRDDKHDLAKDVFPKMLEMGQKILAYSTPEYIKDAGTAERLQRVSSDIEHGVTDRLSIRRMRKAVFVDRDGTINYEINHLTQPDQIKIIEDVPEAIRRLNSLGLLTICVTNQPVVARGDVSFSDLGKIHARLESILGKHKAYLNGIYFCPHHSDIGFSGEIKELKFDCNCRKPKAGLIDVAVEKYSIDRGQSWMVGDSTSDILAGRRAGLKTILLRTGKRGADMKCDVEADFIFDSFSIAVEWIINGYSGKYRQIGIYQENIIKSKVVLISGNDGDECAAVAKVIFDLMQQNGRLVHIISADTNILGQGANPKASRLVSQNNSKKINFDLMNVLNSPRREWVWIETRAKVKKLSIGTNDIIVIHGNQLEHFDIKPDDRILHLEITNDNSGSGSVVHEKNRKMQ